MSKINKNLLNNFYLEDLNQFSKTSLKKVPSEGKLMDMNRTNNKENQTMTLSNYIENFN